MKDIESFYQRYDTVPVFCGAVQYPYLWYQYGTGAAKARLGNGVAWFYSTIRGTAKFAERYGSLYGTVYDDTVWHWYQ
jgi:hypothetical protein